MKHVNVKPYLGRIGCLVWRHDLLNAMFGAELVAALSYRSLSEPQWLAQLTPQNGRHFSCERSSNCSQQSQHCRGAGRMKSWTAMFISLVSRFKHV